MSSLVGMIQEIALFDLNDRASVTIETVPGEVVIFKGISENFKGEPLVSLRINDEVSVTVVGKDIIINLLTKRPRGGPGKGKKGKGKKQHKRSKPHKHPRSKHKHQQRKSKRHQRSKHKHKHQKRSKHHQHSKRKHKHKHKHRRRHMQKHMMKMKMKMSKTKMMKMAKMHMSKMNMSNMMMHFRMNRTSPSPSATPEPKPKSAPKPTPLPSPSPSPSSCCPGCCSGPLCQCVNVCGCDPCNGHPPTCSCACHICCNLLPYKWLKLKKKDGRGKFVYHLRLPYDDTIVIHQNVKAYDERNRQLQSHGEKKAISIFEIAKDTDYSIVTKKTIEELFRKIDLSKITQGRVAAVQPNKFSLDVDGKIHTFKMNKYRGLRNVGIGDFVQVEEERLWARVVPEYNGELLTPSPSPPPLTQS